MRECYQLPFFIYVELSQILFGNPKGFVVVVVVVVVVVEPGNPNTCAETKLCLILFYSGSRSSLL